MAAGGGLSLQFSDHRVAPDTIEGINLELSNIGAGVWPLDLRQQPAEIRALLAKPTLDDAEAGRVKQHFLLPRERLLTIIADAGRVPQVPDGGALETFVTNHGYGYPQLTVVATGADYSRFDRFHVNVAPDGGGGVDEVFQLLSGGGVKIYQRLGDGHTLMLTLSCPDPGHGWLGTYSGVRPHIGSLSSANVGSKLLVQAFGAREWTLTYVDDDP
jgi:hypothetical protein